MSEKKRRISKNQKTEIVLSVLRGESIEELSRTNKVCLHEIIKWRDKFIESGKTGLSKPKSESSKQSELERVIGRQQIEIELLKKKTKGFGTTRGNS